MSDVSKIDHLNAPDHQTTATDTNPQAIAALTKNNQTLQNKLTDHLNILNQKKNAHPNMQATQTTNTSHNQMLRAQW